MNSGRKIVSAGYMPLDLVVREGELLGRHAGGTAANVAAILAFLGWESVLVGHVGGDVGGERLIQDLAGSGVRTDQLRRRGGYCTPRLVHAIGASSHEFLYSCPNCMQRFSRSRPLTLAQAELCVAAHPSADVFFFDRVNHGTVQLAEYYGRQGAVVVFEPSSLTDSNLVTRALSASNVLKLSEEDGAEREAFAIAGSARSDQLQIATGGPSGVLATSGGQVLHKLGGWTVPVLDAGGAGDWMTAGLLAKAVIGGGLHLGALPASLKFAQALAALACTTPGARGLMALSKQTVLRRAREVVAAEGVESRPRVHMPPPRAVSGDHCSVCLLPRIRGQEVAARRTTGGEGNGRAHGPPVVEASVSRY